MAPITSFVKISNLVIPIRIFINRKEILKDLISTNSILFEGAISSSEFQNHKAIIRLKSSNTIYLSNEQISELCNDVLQSRLYKLLFKDSIESIKQTGEAIIENEDDIQLKDKDIVKFLIEDKGWKFKLYLSLKMITSLRIGEIDNASVGLLIRKPKNHKPIEDKNDEIQILQEDETITIPDEVNETEDLTKDEKFIQRYKYSKTRAISKGIKIELLKVPKRH